MFFWSALSDVPHCLGAASPTQRARPDWLTQLELSLMGNLPKTSLLGLFAESLAGRELRACVQHFPDTGMGASDQLRGICCARDVDECGGLAKTCPGRYSSPLVCLAFCTQTGTGGGFCSEHGVWNAYWSALSPNPTGLGFACGRHSGA
jgi:hypothetical protein